MLHQTLEKAVFTYLHYGYLPPKKIPAFLTQLGVYNHIKPTVANTIRLFQEVFKEAIENYQGKGYCVIPVSGGWDSRILLGFALDMLPSHQIKTYTFGTKGQLDFDIGKQLAKKAGVEHVEFDLSKISVTWEGLRASVEKAPWTYVADSFFNKYCYKKMSINADFLLSGFMGDPLTGGHIYWDNGPDIKQKFADSQKFANNQSVTTLELPLESDYKPVNLLPDIPRNTPFSDHQMLDLGVRQSCCIAPIVSFKKQWDSWDTSMGKIEGSNTDVISPFVHPKWVHYWLNVPDSHKNKRKLYLEFLRNKFPKFAEIPGKDFYGARGDSGISIYIKKKKYHAKILLNKHYPHIFTKPKELLNYLDFDRAFRKRDDYREILEKSLLFLKEQSLVDWIDVDNLKEEHMNYLEHHSKIFLLLIGLALNVEVMNKSVE